MHTRASVVRACALHETVQRTHKTLLKDRNRRKIIHHGFCTGIYSYGVHCRDFSPLQTRRIYAAAVSRVIYYERDNR